MEPYFDHFTPVDISCFSHYWLWCPVIAPIIGAIGEWLNYICRWMVRAHGARISEQSAYSSTIHSGSLVVRASSIDRRSSIPRRVSSSNHTTLFRNKEARKARAASNAERQKRITGTDSPV